MDTRPTAKRCPTNWRDTAWSDPDALDWALKAVRADVQQARLGIVRGDVAFGPIERALHRAEGRLSGLIGDIEAEPAAGDAVIAGKEG